MPLAAVTVFPGIDVGKTHYWAEVVDASVVTLLSRRVLNDQVETDALIVAVGPLADAQQQVRYASGRVVSVLSSAFTGEGKTDAKDAHVIAETAPAAPRPAHHRPEHRPGPQPGRADRAPRGPGR